MTDEEMERMIARQEWWDTPEGQAEEARDIAAYEAIREEADEIEAKIEARLKELKALEDIEFEDFLKFPPF